MAQLHKKFTDDAYRKISIGGFAMKTNGTPHDEIELRIYPLNYKTSEIRFWCNGNLIGVRKVKKQRPQRRALLNFI